MSTRRIAVAALPRLAVMVAIGATVLVAPAPPAYSTDQIDNAVAIIAAAGTLHLDRAAATLGITAALGESDLHDLDYGDGAINPDGTVADSVGLFQQQHWWSTIAQRMNPTAAATGFYRHLEAVHDWEDLAPTAAIHAVQDNADPNYYTPYYPLAQKLVAALEITVTTPVNQPTLPDQSTAVVTPPPEPWDFGSVTAELTAALDTAVGLPADETQALSDRSDR